MFSVQNFRVKNEIQNSTAEFASLYGMAARVATRSASVRVAPPAPARRPPVAGRRPGLPDRRTATASRPRYRPPAPHGTAARTGTGTAKHRPAWRRGEAPDGLRPFVNKKAGNP